MCPRGVPGILLLSCFCLILRSHLDSPLSCQLRLRIGSTVPPRASLPITIGRRPCSGCCRVGRWLSERPRPGRRRASRCRTRRSAVTVRFSSPDCCLRRHNNNERGIEQTMRTLSITTASGRACDGSSKTTSSARSRYVYARPPILIGRMITPSVIDTDGYLALSQSPRNRSSRQTPTTSFTIKP